MSATEKIMDEVRALVVLDVTPESLGQLAALRHTIARTIGDLERARDAALEERTRLGVELAGARTRIADLESRAAAAAAEMTAWTELDAERDRRDRAQREMALHAMAEAERLRSELACYRPAGWLMTAPVQADESPRPAGWKVAPVDPTPEMIDAADSVDWRDDDTRGSVINMWHCMLAVAPEQAEPVGGCSDSVSCPRGER